MIRIVNDFFEEDKFNQVLYHVKNKIYYSPRYFEGGPVGHKKTHDDHYGNRFTLNKDKKLLNVFMKQAEKKFNFKITKIYSDCGIDMRNLKTFQPHHDYVDGIKLNILIMLDGPIGVTTGTVYYTDGELDIHVGFRPNRAVLFPSNYVHSAHQSETENLKRYTATLFVEDYESLK